MSAIHPMALARNIEQHQDKQSPQSMDVTCVLQWQEQADIFSEFHSSEIEHILVLLLALLAGLIILDRCLNY